MLDLVKMISLEPATKLIFKNDFKIIAPHNIFPFTSIRFL